MVLAGQDLETLKVLWSRGPGTKEVQKVPRTKNSKSPGTMESLIDTNKAFSFSFIIMKDGESSGSQVFWALFLTCPLEKSSLICIFLNNNF